MLKGCFGMQYWGSVNLCGVDMLDIGGVQAKRSMLTAPSMRLKLIHSRHSRHTRARLLSDGPLDANSASSHPEVQRKANRFPSGSVFPAIAALTICAAIIENVMPFPPKPITAKARSKPGTRSMIGRPSSVALNGADHV